jgi:hypothetical protein
MEISSIIIMVSILLIAFGFISNKTWFPKSIKEFRVSEKQIGEYTYYRPELKRPFWGWTGFFANKSNGMIYEDNEWLDNKEWCEEQIKIYKKLNNYDIKKSKTSRNKGT